jgi:uncharacterized protein YxjI
MRYVMSRKFMSWGSDFVIRDESGRDLYFVYGKVFNLGDQLLFQDKDGNELASIQQKLFTWGRTYEIHGQGQRRAVVEKAFFTLF